MRTSGMIPYITPRQIATESSSVPKSVMNTMVGGYVFAASFPAHAPEGESVSKRIASVTETVFRTRNCSRRIEDEIIHFSLSQVQQRDVSGFYLRLANKRPYIFTLEH